MSFGGDSNFIVCSGYCWVSRMVELILATIHLKTGFPPKYVLNGVYLILTCAKAFYIIAEFMHLRHEIKNLIMTIAVPACCSYGLSSPFFGMAIPLKTCATDMTPIMKSKTKKAPPAEEHEPAAQKPGAAE